MCSVLCVLASPLSICVDCGRYLKDPGSKLMRAAVNVLCAVASGSLTACTYIITSVLPILLEQHSLLKQVQMLIQVQAKFQFFTPKFRV